MLPVVVVLALLALAGSMSAQPGAIAGQAGEVGLGLVLRQLGNVGVFLQAVGHPDDENSAVLAMLTHGQGIRTAVLTATRGTGGQNEIGPELFEALSVLRTEELAAVHRYDGAEQYFARAIDFGYSFSVDETFRKWGRQEVLADYVRMIRTIRPDVIVTMRRKANRAAPHHQAQARITGEAFRLAADPSSVPRAAEGGPASVAGAQALLPGGFGGRGGRRAAAGGTGHGPRRPDIYDPLLGQTYVEIGSAGAEQPQVPGHGAAAVPARRRRRRQLPAGRHARCRRRGPRRPDLFDGIDTSLGGLADFARAPAPEALKAGLAAIAAQVDNAQKAFKSQGPEAAREPIVAGLGAVRALRSRLGSLNLDEGARFEIDTG